MTPPSAPIAGDQREVWRPFMSDPLQQPKQVRMEGVAPGDPVVAVAELVQARVVAAAGAATPRARGWRAGSPRRCRRRARSGSSARAGCGGRRRRSGRSARSAGTSARGRRRGGRSCPTGGRARRSSPGGGGERGGARARRGSRRGRSASARAEAPAGSPRRARGRSGPRPSRSRSGRPGRAASARSGGSRPSRVEQGRVLGVLGAVVRDEQRARSVASGMGPDERGQLGAEDAARDRHALRARRQAPRRPSPGGS